MQIIQEYMVFSCIQVVLFTIFALHKVVINVVQSQ